MVSEPMTEISTVTIGNWNMFGISPYNLLAKHSDSFTFIGYGILMVMECSHFIDAIFVLFHFFIYRSWMQ